MSFPAPGTSAFTPSCHQTPERHFVRWGFVLFVFLTIGLTTSVGRSGEHLRQTPRRDVQTRVAPANPAPHLVPPGPIAPTPRLGFRGYLRRGWGMMVNYALPGTHAARLGLEPGDVIVRLNGHRITSAQVWNVQMRRSVYVHGGRLTLLIDNVRARTGHNGGPRYVFRTVWMNEGHIYAMPRKLNTNSGEEAF